MTAFLFLFSLSLHGNKFWEYAAHCEKKTALHETLPAFVCFGPFLPLEKMSYMWKYSHTYRRRRPMRMYTHMCIMCVYVPLLETMGASLVLRDIIDTYVVYTWQQPRMQFGDCFWSQGSIAVQKYGSVFLLSHSLIILQLLSVWTSYKAQH